MQQLSKFFCLVLVLIYSVQGQAFIFSDSLASIPLVPPRLVFPDFFQPLDISKYPAPSEKAPSEKALPEKLPERVFDRTPTDDFLAFHLHVVSHHPSSTNRISIKLEEVDDGASVEILNSVNSSVYSVTGGNFSLLMDDNEHSATILWRQAGQLHLDIISLRETDQPSCSDEEVGNIPLYSFSIMLPVFPVDQQAITLEQVFYGCPVKTSSPCINDPNEALRQKLRKESESLILIYLARIIALLRGEVVYWMSPEDFKRQCYLSGNSCNGLSLAVEAPTLDLQLPSSLMESHRRSWMVMLGSNSRGSTNAIKLKAKRAPRKDKRRVVHLIPAPSSATPPSSAPQQQLPSSSAAKTAKATPLSLIDESSGNPHIIRVLNRFISLLKESAAAGEDQQSITTSMMVHQPLLSMANYMVVHLSTTAFIDEYQRIISALRERKLQTLEDRAQYERLITYLIDNDTPLTPAQIPTIEPGQDYPISSPSSLLEAFKEFLGNQGTQDVLNSDPMQNYYEDVTLLTGRLFFSSSSIPLSEKQHMAAAWLEETEVLENQWRSLLTNTPILTPRPMDTAVAEEPIVSPPQINDEIAPVAAEEVQQTPPDQTPTEIQPEEGVPLSAETTTAEVRAPTKVFPITVITDKGITPEERPRARTLTEVPPSANVVNLPSSTDSTAANNPIPHQIIQPRASPRRFPIPLTRQQGIVIPQVRLQPTLRQFINSRGTAELPNMISHPASLAITVDTGAIFKQTYDQLRSWYAHGGYPNPALNQIFVNAWKINFGRQAFIQGFSPRQIHEIFEQLYAMWFESQLNLARH